MNVGGLNSKYYDDSQRDDTILLSQSSASRRAKTLYRLSLMEPSFHTGVRVPTEFPQPSATASLRFNYNITPNSTGKFLLLFDPFKRDYNIYNDSTLNGINAGVATVKTTTIDSTFIDMFRVVSCEVRLTYTGQLQVLAGFITGAITSNIAGSDQSLYLNFENIENSQQKMTISPLNGIRLIYVPRDPSMLDFMTVSTFNAGTYAAVNKYMMTIYGDNLPNTACIRVDIYYNIEYVSKLNVREYIPHSVNNSGRIDYDELNQISPISVST